MDKLAELTTELVAFRDERNWKQFHTLKNLILSVSIEAAELLELTQWKAEPELELIDFSEEIADVFIYLLMICERTGIDLIQATRNKIIVNNQKYPITTSYGNNKKHKVLDARR